MTAWLFPRYETAGSDVGAYTSGPWKIVVHTTEVHADIDNGWLAGWKHPSHIVVDPVRRKVAQCLPLDRAARSLVGGAGYETNRDSAIQVEIVAYSDLTLAQSRDAARWHVTNLTDDDLNYVAAGVLAPVCAWVRSQGGEIDLDDVPPLSPIGGSASTSAPQRFTPARWDNFAGLCGHRHVPNNAHWDPGELDLRKLAAYTRSALDSTLGPASDPPPLGDGMLTTDDKTWIEGMVRAVAADLSLVVHAAGGNVMAAVSTMVEELAARLAPPTVDPPVSRVHVAAAGDTVWSIAASAGIPLERIYQLNPDLRTMPLPVGFPVVVG